MKIIYTNLFYINKIHLNSVSFLKRILFMINNNKRDFDYILYLIIFLFLFVKFILLLVNRLFYVWGDIALSF